MKLGKLGILTFIATITATVLFAASEPKKIDEDSLGLRKVDLMSEEKAAPAETKYGTSQPMSGYKIERAYQNAPPMIPHDVEGLLEITPNNNACMGCHEPAVAESMGATPIPKSHFTNFRPETHLNKDGKIVKEGKVVENTSDIKTVNHKTMDTLAGARFNCSQCHAPQSEGNNVPKNNFATEFRSESLTGKSNLIDNINEGVK